MMSRGPGADLAIGMDVGHDIVAQPALVLGGAAKVDVVDVAAKFVRAGRGGCEA